MHHWNDVGNQRRKIYGLDADDGNYMTITAYPLTWPEGFPRAKSRTGSAFKTSLAAALKNVQKSIQLFGQDSGKKAESIVISSNCSLGNDRPSDPGVAVWFIWDGVQVCIPVDRYQKVEDNLQAIHHILEARRTELRHGGIAIVRATFTGFRALPNPSARNWRDVLGKDITSRDQLEFTYRRLRSDAHPDKGGNAERFNDIQRAYDDALKELAA